MITFLKVLLVFVIIYYLVKIIFKHFLQKFLNNYNSNRKDFFHTQEKKEGEVTLEKTEQKEKKHSKNEGEYIDFEEVDEE